MPSPQSHSRLWGCNYSFPGTQPFIMSGALGGKIQLLHLRVIHLFVYAYKVVMNTEPFFIQMELAIPNCGIVQIEQRLHQLLIIVVHFFQRIARKAQDIWSSPDSVFPNAPHWQSPDRQSRKTLKGEMNRLGFSTSVLQT